MVIMAVYIDPRSNNYSMMTTVTAVMTMNRNPNAYTNMDLF